MLWGRETTLHNLACKDKMVAQIFHHLVEKLDELMVGSHMDLDVHVVVKQAILIWKENWHYNLKGKLSPCLVHVILAQGFLGWKAFIEGCISIQLRGIQQ